METPVLKLYELFRKGPAKVSTDSRKDVSGSLFFALSGDKFNGNEFASAALDKGARLAVIDELRFKKDDNYLLVPDVLKALQQLALHHRKMMKDLVVLAITGSNGKTTTKELVAAVLQTGKKIVATQGNLNNHIGVPLTLLSISNDTEVAIVEMGANHPGEIQMLCELAMPQFGLITNIGKAHLEGFGSFEGVIRAKNELYDFLRTTGGTAIVHADDPLLMQLSEGLARFTYGQDSGALKGKPLQTIPALSFSWQHENVRGRCNTHLYGSYNFPNLLAAAAVGRLMGIPAENIDKALSAYLPANNRSQQIETKRNIIFLDAYNANPVSMSLAIKSFGAAGYNNPCLILGDMFELGKYAQDEHCNILELVEQAGFTNVLLVGKDFYRLRKPGKYLFFEETGQAAAYLQKNAPVQAAVFIKGSRGMHLEDLVKYL